MSDGPSVDDDPLAVSPGGTWVIRTSAWEARMSHWIEMPTLIERATGATVFAFDSRDWSLDGYAWLDDLHLRIVVRKYPGNRQPADVTVTLDCATGQAVLEDGRTVPLHRLEGVLDAELALRPQVRAGRLPG